MASSSPSANFVAWVNNLRALVHVGPLTTDPVLTNVAQTWANNVAASGVLGHNPSLATQAPSGWTQIAENVADGSSLNLVSAALQSLLGTANMLNPALNRTGVGVATDSKGVMWVVQDFGDYPPPTPATFVFPTNGTKILPGTQSFSWAQAPGAQNYAVTVGTAQGGFNVYQSGLLPATQLSVLVTGLPVLKTLWARLFTYNQGTWTWSDASFTVI